MLFVGRPRRFRSASIALMPVGLMSHDYRPQSAGATGRQLASVRVSALMVAPPLILGHRNPTPSLTFHRSAPQPGPPAPRVHVPLFPTPEANPRTGTPTPPFLHAQLRFHFKIFVFTVFVSPGDHDQR
ncbi:MAG: hypothetical protein Q7I94_04840, partial [Candidatus Contubernalis sp.]|nr:hypothetical protein [Candidatus Contubernalis sp.]